MVQVACLNCGNPNKCICEESPPSCTTCDHLTSPCSECDDCSEWEEVIDNPFLEPQQSGNHYRKGNTMDVAEWCERRKHSPSVFNIIKYVDRHKEKNGIDDLRKAHQYLKFLAYIEYKENL